MHFDWDKEYFVETDTSDSYTAGVLSQYDEDQTLRPVAYFSAKINPSECNYKIYNKELLAIIRALEEWRPELIGTKDPINLITDYKNLKWFTSGRQLKDREIR